jgi:endoglucanase Acf2
MKEEEEKFHHLILWGVSITNKELREIAPVLIGIVVIGLILIAIFMH